MFLVFLGDKIKTLQRDHQTRMLVCAISPISSVAHQIRSTCCSILWICTLQNKSTPLHIFFISIDKKIIPEDCYYAPN